MPDVARTLESLLTDVHLRLGYANMTSGRPVIQADKSITATSIAAFNEAGRKMTLAQMWTWRQGRYQIIIDNLGTQPMAVKSEGATVGSPWRYRLEPWVMGVGQDGAFWKEDNIQGGNVSHVSPDLVLRAHAERPAYNGWPQFFAVQPYRESSEYLNNPRLSQRPSLEVLLYPIPYKQMTLDLSVRLGYTDLQSLQEAPPWPEDFDDAAVTLTCANMLRGGEAPKKGMSEDKEYSKYLMLLADLKRADQMNKSVVRSPVNRGVPRYRAVAPVFIDGSFVI